MDDIVEFIYFKKRKTVMFEYTHPSKKELSALENFDDTLTEEQRKLFREYELLLSIRIEALNKEMFSCGFNANNDVEILKAHLKRVD